MSRIRVVSNEQKKAPYSPLNSNNENVPDLAIMEDAAYTIPGMVTPYSGGHLYSLCYFQMEQGDVVEIGSWQGRSTAFLARATHEAKNGEFFAIDHFQGNVGRESYYIVGEDDLSDLKKGFLKNMDDLGLTEHVNLLDMNNTNAAKKIKDKSVRFLFIDGDHTKEGVEKDIELFFPKLIDDGAIIAFDDFSPSFPGVIETVSDLLGKKKHCKVMAYKNTLIMKLKTK